MKSVAHRTYLWLAAKNVGVVIDVIQTRTKFADTQEGDSATTSLSMMTTAGVLERISYGRYKILPGLKKWGEAKKWARAPKRRKSFVPHPTDHRGDDVIENLLTAMAAAEPELKRLQKQDKLIRQAREL